MGRYHEDGYSAHVEGFFVVAGTSIPLIKTNELAFVIAEPAEFPPHTRGEILVIIDGDRSSRTVILPDGIQPGQTSVNYQVEAPF